MENAGVAKVLGVDGRPLTAAVVVAGTPAPVAALGDIEVRGPDGKVVFHKSKELGIGHVLANGWKYGGISPFTQRPFAWAPDYSFDGRRVTWNQAVAYDAERETFGHRDSATFRYVDQNGQIRDKDGKVRTVEEDDGGARGSTREELNQAWENHRAIGGFKATWHWSSTECNKYDVDGQGFGDGAGGDYYKGNGLLARCVRSLQHGGR